MYHATSSVLLVDSNRDGLELYSTALALEGIDTITAESASEALDRLRADHPRVLVTGLRLAGAEATCLIAKARRTAPASELFIVGLSTTEASPPAAYAAGCDLVLKVPCLPETLVTELRRALS